MVFERNALLLLLALIALSAQACPSSYPITYIGNDCTFFVSHTDSTCSSFNFSHCTYCSSTPKGSSTCSSKKTLTSYAECTRKCCSHEMAYS